MARRLGNQLGSGLNTGLNTGLGAVGSLGDYLREQRQANRLSLRQLAAAAGVSNPYLSQIERGLRRPSAEVLQALAKALRISAETLYVQAGILSPDDTEARSVELSIRADTGLSERQKDALVDIYRSFRGSNGAPVDTSPSEPGPSPTYDSQHDTSEHDTSVHDTSVEGH